MKLVGKLQYEGKQYTNQDVKGVMPLNQLGLDNDFYGGNVSQFGITETPGLYLCLNKTNNVIDILISDIEIPITKPKTTKKK